MIKKKDVHKNLALLDELFTNSRNRKTTVFYSKLAVIELCGWIEAAMDDIIIGYTNRKITNIDDLAKVKDKVKNNSNLGYTNLRELSILLVGLKRIRIIESNLDATGDLNILVNTLNTLRSARNNFAHTHVHGTITSVSSPQSLLTSFTTVYRILKLYQNYLNRH